MVSGVGMQYVIKYKCVDSPEEQETTDTEKSYQVSCFISHGEEGGKNEKRCGGGGKGRGTEDSNCRALSWGLGWSGLLTLAGQFSPDPVSVSGQYPLKL